MSENVELLKWYVMNHMTVGGTAEIATSKYANSHSAAGPLHHFDEHSTPQAVRSLVKSGLIDAWCGWRYYRITRLR